MTFRTRSTLLACFGLDPALRSRLDQCGTPAPWGWRFCKLPACDRCRRHRALEWADEAATAFTMDDGDQWLLTSIVLDLVPGVAGLHGEIARTRKALRNLMARVRADDPRADDVRLIGAFGFDWDAVASGWRPQLRVVAGLVGLPERKLRDRLDTRWRGRVTMIPMPFRTSSLPTQVEVGRWLDFTDQVRWPDARFLEFHHAIFEAGGFSLFRFHLRPVAYPQNDVIEGDDQDYGAMPTILGWSDFNPFHTSV